MKKKEVYLVVVHNIKWGNYVKEFDSRYQAVKYAEEAECDLNTYCHVVNLTAAVKRYNELMNDLCREHCTIGEQLSEGTENWTLRDMVAECDYELSTYYEDGHMNGDLRYGDSDERKAWKSETGRLKRFIDKYAPVVKYMKCAEGHCSKFDG